MQDQTSSDTASSTPDIPSHKWLNLGIAAGVILLIGGVLMGVYTFYVETLHPHYHYIHHHHNYWSYSYGPIKDKISRGLEWYLWVPLILGGLFIAICFGEEKCTRNNYWFRAVPQGKIVDEHEEQLFFGGCNYYFTVEGKNRAGKVCEQTRRVSSKKYFNNDIGDEISFIKE